MLPRPFYVSFTRDLKAKSLTSELPPSVFISFTCIAISIEGFLSVLSEFVGIPLLSASP
jgi:hypothetical protein